MKNKTLLVGLLFLNFCAQAQKKKGAKQLEKTGIALGTISMQNIGFITTGFYLYYNTDSMRALQQLKKNNVLNKMNFKNNYAIVINHGPYDFKEEKRVSFFFKIEKPIGKYKFDNLGVFKNSGMMQSLELRAIDFPFEIKEDSVLYLGDIQIDDEGNVVEMVNNFQRDSTRISKHYPKLNLSNAQ